jgi:diguanylate cyclase (GGDEF)-like protein
MADLSQKVARLQRLAATDALTGLANRRAFDEALHRQWRRNADDSRTLAIALLDVDYFKAFNDTYGHVAGDDCLRRLAAAIAHAVRTTAAIVARYGGEEFAIVFSRVDEKDAILIGEAVCESVRALRIVHSGSSLGYVTVSIGVYATIPDADAVPQEAVHRADELLYRAKRGGRNRVAANEYESESPEAHVRARGRHNLPATRSRLIGRERDVDVVAEGLRRGRLVTIAGPGGVGKTSLALAVAQAAIEQAPGGVWFVDLAPVGDVAAVPETIAQAIGANRAPGEDPLTVLLEHMRPLQALVVVDNCEHVVAGAASAVDRMLAECPHVRILATSREPLRVAGESLYRLSPLDRDAAIELFCERAREADLQFAPTAEDIDTIAAICSRLDGIALAIELAAARLRVLTLSSLFDRLRESFRLLSGGSRTALARQQTMRALIDWSYDLLSEEERKVLMYLSLFASACTTEVVATTCRQSPDDTFDILASLVDKSLVVAGAPGARTRYRLLEPVRQYARDRLVECGDLATVQRSFAAAYADHAERWETTWETASDRVIRELVDSEFANVRVALEWSFSSGGSALIGQRIVAAIARPWSRTSAEEFEGWIHVALRAVQASTPRLIVARLEIALANVAMLFSRRSECAEAALRAEALLEGESDSHARAEVKALNGWALRTFGRPDEGAALIREALAIYREIGALRSCGWALYMLANAYWVSGDVDGALPFFAEALDTYVRIGADQSIGVLAGNRAEAEFSVGSVALAMELAERARTALRAAGQEQALAWNLCNMAAYLIAQDRWDEARATAREGLDRARERRMQVKIVWALQHLAAAAALRTREPSDAHRCAAALLGFADRQLAALGAHRMHTERQEYERLVATLHLVLGEPETAALARRGAEWSEDRAIAEALML